MATVLSGASFGAAMIAAGFYNPAVVISQLKFENWHMVQAFLAATASSMYAPPHVPFCHRILILIDSPS